MSDDNQRVFITERARELFLEKGYGRTTIDDVAARCHVSKQTLYRLFAGKQGLFAAVVEAHRQSMLALPGSYEGLPLDVALERIFQVDIDSEADRERVALLRMIMVEARQFPELGGILRRHGAEQAHAELSRWLAAQRRRGAIEIDDARSAARMLMDMIFGALAFKTEGSMAWPGEGKRKAHVRRCIAVFLKGVVPRRTGSGRSRNR